MLGGGADLESVRTKGALHEEDGEALVLQEFAARCDANEHILGSSHVRDLDGVATGLLDHLVTHPTICAELARLQQLGCDRLDAREILGQMPGRAAAVLHAFGVDYHDLARANLDDQPLPDASHVDHLSGAGADQGGRMCARLRFAGRCTTCGRANTS